LHAVLVDAAPPFCLALWGFGGALRVQLLKKLVMTLSGRYDGTTIQKKGLP